MSRRSLGLTPGLAPDLPLRPPVPLPAALGDPRTRLIGSPRDAFASALRSAGVGAGSVVLVPEWRRRVLDAALDVLGARAAVYALGPHLLPDEPALDAVAGEATALVLAHPLGLPAGTARWQAWAADRGIALVEDLAGTWAAAWEREPPRSAPAAVLAVGPLLGAAFRRLPVAVTGAAGAEDELPRAEAAARDLAARALALDPAARRRANTRLLVDLVGPDHVPAPFRALDAAAVPSALPLLTPHPARTLAALEASGVRATALELPGGHGPAVALPVHQGLGPADIQRIAAASAPSSRRAGAAEELEITEAGSVAALAEEWDALGHAADDLFATRAWFETWWEVFGADGDLRLFGLRRRGGELAAVVALQLVTDGATRTLRFAGHGVADQLGPVCRPADVPAVGRALRRILDDRIGGWDVLDAAQLPREAGWGTVLGGRVTEREEAPVVDLGDGGWDAFLATRSSNLRQQVRRRERKLQREHGLELRLATDEVGVREGMDTLVALHRARWAGTGEDAFAGRAEAFHRRLAGRALAEGTLRLWVAELDGRPAAAWYGFRWNGSDWYFQAGREPELEQTSVGFVLLTHTMRDASEGGSREYRLLRGDEPFKYRFATRADGLESLVVHRGARGRALEASALAARVGRQVRRRLA